jgi:manganese/zinc/iron transport system permease protein
VGLGVTSSVAGYGLARWLDASIAGSMAAAAGALFFLALLASPRHGLAAKALRHRRLRLATAEQLLLLHLSEEGEEVSLGDLGRRFAWGGRRLGQVVRKLVARGWVEAGRGALALTPAGAAALESSGQAALRHRG